ncbi:MAG: hypothetical protein RLZZ524_1326 [Pseudomonadota bacterium]
MKTGAVHGRIGTRRPDSLVSKLERLYAENPHEWFTPDDLTLKLSCQYESLLRAIHTVNLNCRMRIKAVTVYARVEDE